VWTVAELLGHANHVLKDSAKAEEITQDALIKFMLAAPALSYPHPLTMRTVWEKIGSKTS
jgi:DNA-directed RNA polymerase specialized sigma24 family protein